MIPLSRHCSAIRKYGKPVTSGWPTPNARAWRHCRETGEEFDDARTKAEASKRIDELRTFAETLGSMTPCVRLDFDLEDGSDCEPGCGNVAFV